MKTTFCLAVLLFVTCVAFAQDLAIGTKTAPAMIVASIGKTSAPAEIQNEVQAGLRELWGACQRAQLHPVGLPILSVDLIGAQNGTLNWEAWLMLADQLDPNNLPKPEGLKLKPVPATSVAYTYQQGNPWELEAAFTRLVKWATNQNLPIATRVRALIYVWPDKKDDNDVISECQLELRQ